MARISTYSKDVDVTKDDQLLGTDVGGSTKNYSLENITKFITNTNASGIVGQLPFVFHNSTFGGTSNRKDGSICSVPILSASQSNKNFNTLTKVKVSKYAYSSQNTSVNLLNQFVDKDIIIADNINNDNFGVYTCTAVTQDSTETDFYDLDLTYKNGNGAMVVNQFYSIILYSGAQDKGFKHNQVSASNTWVINHNLNKFPSVVVIDSAGSQAIGAVTHNSKNQLTLSFSASFSGVAHLN